ncbi:hypothetical protein JMA_10930 [Jeotgalibacillus malaysiensis]|uniref:HAAS transmembrane region domain-containing protein n=1 Tax=Jeotgalibacillus malaysiensis TaxID=1508404 RepID=A0A0B5AJ90_9BACL|nr:hypothetical protein [Jeotgalibacillus malaysiensis]AJD90410.1 hypothetical protein JMA_10930 [Jeotgalibacillus malaysiensis]
MPELSKESRRFIDDLRLYLFSSGKNSEEINEIAEELEVHLAEAEQNGKPIEQVVGDSPKEYMEMISGEMKFDKKGWLKYIPLIVFGVISFSVIGQLMENMKLSYSYAMIGGSVIMSILFILMIFGVFKYTTSRQVSRVKEFFLIMIPIFVNMVLFMSLVFWDMYTEMPGIELGVTASMSVGVILLAILIWISVWAKTAVLPVMLAAVHVPELLLRMTSLGLEARLITGLLITYAVIGLYFFYTVKKMKKAEAAAG